MTIVKPWRLCRADRYSLKRRRQVCDQGAQAIIARFVSAPVCTDRHQRKKLLAPRLIPEHVRQASPSRYYGMHLRKTEYRAAVSTAQIHPGPLLSQSGGAVRRPMLLAAQTLGFEEIRAKGLCQCGEFVFRKLCVTGRSQTPLVHRTGLWPFRAIPLDRGRLGHLHESA